MIAPGLCVTPSAPPRSFHGPARRSRRRRSPRGRHPDPGNDPRPARLLISVLVVPVPVPVPVVSVRPFARPDARRAVPVFCVVAVVRDVDSPRVLRRRRSNHRDRLRHHPCGPSNVALRASSTRGVRVLRLTARAVVSSVLLAVSVRMWLGQ
jgi:hypothetical protein